MHNLTHFPQMDVCPVIENAYKQLGRGSMLMPKYKVHTGREAVCVKQ
jgi:hypothetical protein